MWLSDDVEEFPVNNDADEHIQDLFGADNRFETPKPEGLLKRIIEIASDPGDVVLDCFLGSGSTASTAQKLRRRWVGIERDAATVGDFARPRLARVVQGEDEGGITAAVDWGGGGGFRGLEVAPSMFTEDEGLVVLAEWATNGTLAEVTAAQLGFTYEPQPPFAARKGRKRLAVIDGLISEDVVRLLVSSLPDDDRLTVCGTAIEPSARTVLRELRPGSTLRKILRRSLLSIASARGRATSGATCWRRTVAARASCLGLQSPTARMRFRGSRWVS